MHLKTKTAITALVGLTTGAVVGFAIKKIRSHRKEKLELDEFSSVDKSELRNVICYVKCNDYRIIDRIPKCLIMYDNMVIIRNTDGTKAIVERVVPDINGNRILTEIDWDCLEITDSPRVTERDAYIVGSRAVSEFIMSNSENTQYNTIYRFFLNKKSLPPEIEEKI